MQNKPNNKTILARNLRKDSIKQERILWKLLRNSNVKNYKFRRQYPVGNYIVDFICIEKHLIIELDGGQHNELDNIVYDNERTDYLNSRGFKVIRFWNNDVDKNIAGVYEAIIKELE